jgi:hypothetical protein
LGAGAVMASVVSSVPQIVWFSEHKLGVFIFAGVMLSISSFLQWQARSLPCPSDKDLADLCNKTRVNSFRIYIFSVSVFLIGGFMAFLAPLLIS